MLCSNGSDVVVAVVDLEDVDVIVEEVVVIITIEPSRSNSSRRSSSSSSSSVRLEGERSPYSEWGDTAIAVMVVEVVIVA